MITVRIKGNIMYKKILVTFFLFFVCISMNYSATVTLSSGEIYQGIVIDGGDFIVIQTDDLEIKVNKDLVISIVENGQEIELKNKGTVETIVINPFVTIVDLVAYDYFTIGISSQRHLSEKLASSNYVEMTIDGSDLISMFLYGVDYYYTNNNATSLNGSYISAQAGFLHVGESNFFLATYLGTGYTSISDNGFVFKIDAGFFIFPGLLFTTKPHLSMSFGWAYRLSKKEAHIGYTYTSY
jgi:hypothetical protein